MSVNFSGYPLDNCENLWSEDVVIPSGGNVAPAVMTQGHALVGILMPAAWTAAVLGFEASIDNITYATVEDAFGVYVQSAAAASIFIALPAPSAVYAPFLKLKSVDATNVAVNQAADRTLRLIFRRYLGGA